MSKKYNWLITNVNAQARTMTVTYTSKETTGKGSVVQKTLNLNLPDDPSDLDAVVRIIELHVPDMLWKAEQVVQQQVAVTNEIEQALHNLSGDTVAEESARRYGAKEEEVYRRRLSKALFEMGLAATDVMADVK